MKDAELKIRVDEKEISAFRRLVFLAKCDDKSREPSGIITLQDMVQYILQQNKAIEKFLADNLEDD